MSKTRTLADFVRLLAALDAEAFPFVVIGGCAVGAYARMRGESVVTSDLDLYVTHSTLQEMLEWAERQGISVLERPQPRTVSVAVLDWDGKEVNLLSGVRPGLPEPDVAVRTARELELAAEGLSIPLADPYDILANKLQIHRDKDLPHIEVLRQFVDEEVVEAFCNSKLTGRERLEPARRLLAALGSELLPKQLGARLITGPLDTVTRRFLVARLPNNADAERIVEMVAEPAERTILDRILRGRAQ